VTGRARVLRRFIRGKAVIAVAVLLGVALTLPSLDVGWIGDDVFQRWILTEDNGSFADVRPASGDMFDFADGDAARTRRMQRQGLLPWWTHAETRARFWRPLTVLTHRFDYRAWPASPRLMHAQNVTWYGLLVAAVALLYRRMMGRTLAAALAAVAFAVEDAHAINVGWIASRNALVAATFGVLAIHAHARSRRGRATARLGWAALATALFGAALLSAEAGVATMGYLVAFALVMDRRAGRWRTRLMSLTPYVAVIVLWRLAWRAGGYGVYAVETLYVDPVASPLQFARVAMVRVPMLMMGQFGYPPADIATFVNDAGELIIAGIAVAVLAPIAWMIWPLLRARRVARFWLAGLLLSSVPLCAAFASNRQLLFVGIGAFGLVGQFLSWAAHRRFRAGLSRGRRFARFALVAATVIVHFVAAPVVLALFARWPIGPPEMWQAMTEMPQITRADASRDVIVVGHPIAANLMETLTGRAVDGRPLPRSAAVLAPSSTPLTVGRVDERTLVISGDDGFFADEVSRLLYSMKHPPVAGETIELAAVRVTVTSSMPDGRPRAVRYDFHVPLEDASLHWLTWRNGSFEPWTPPAVGRKVVLPRGRFPF
jgi:hypothetical protein